MTDDRWFPRTAKNRSELEESAESTPKSSIEAERDALKKKLAIAVRGLKYLSEYDDGDGSEALEYLAAIGGVK